MTTDNRPLVDRIAQAIGDPGSIVGRKLGPSWGEGNAGYAETEETVTRWSTRAVLALVEPMLAEADEDHKYAVAAHESSQAELALAIEHRAKHTAERDELAIEVAALRIQHAEAATLIARIRKVATHDCGPFCDDDGCYSEAADTLDLVRNLLTDPTTCTCYREHVQVPSASGEDGDSFDIVAADCPVHRGDETCGDCAEGRCHGGDEDGSDIDDTCGCALHEASTRDQETGELLPAFAAYLSRCCGDHEPTCAVTDVGAECCTDCPDKAEERQRRAADDELHAALGSAYYSRPYAPEATQTGGA